MPIPISLAAVMRSICYDCGVQHPELPMLRQKCIEVAGLYEGVEVVQVALLFRDWLQQGYSVAQVLEADTKQCADLGKGYQWQF